jgi:hypothetical protein
MVEPRIVLSALVRFSFCEFREGVESRMLVDGRGFVFLDRAGG